MTSKSMRGPLSKGETTFLKMTSKIILDPRAYAPVYIHVHIHTCVYGGGSTVEEETGGSLVFTLQTV